MERSTRTGAKNLAFVRQSGKLRTVSEPLVLRGVSLVERDQHNQGRRVSLPAELLSCWQRSAHLGAPQDGALAEDHLVRGQALRERREPFELIETLGTSVLDLATARVSRNDFLLILSDAEGVVLRASGGGSFESTAKNLRLIEGACWSEKARGTNAIGTAAALNRPTQVHGLAHYGLGYRDLVCYAAPIRNLDGNVVAVLDATSHVERANPEIGNIVVQGARALEELLRLGAYATAGASVTRALGRSLDRMNDPALLLEPPGTIVRANSAARTVLRADVLSSNISSITQYSWSELVSEALAPSSKGLYFEANGANRANWHLRIDPITSHCGDVLALMVVFERSSPVFSTFSRLSETTQPFAHTPSRPVETDSFSAIFAEDPHVLAAIEWSRKLARSDLPVMILAETGAGKELFAQAIHQASTRASGPWFATNCGAMTPSLLEAELFGYAPGAFTGAEKTGRLGLFHAASGGTLLLDEVAEMSPAMQTALLRVLETNTFRRVGDVKTEKTDVRIICATCRDLQAMVANGQFRQDLYYRLKGAVVRLPPLRSRSDVLPLALHLLRGEAKLSPEAESVLLSYSWPGNIRELKSTLAVAKVAASDGYIMPEDLGLDIQATSAAGSALQDAERQALTKALEQSGGNVSEAARILHVARSTIHRMKRRYNLE